jgi:dipeptidyl-peptidase-3
MESPQIFRLIHRINLAQTPEDLRKSQIAAGFSEDDVDAFFIFCSGVYTNMGNYKSFGDSKFVPDLKPETFEDFIKKSKAW